ncbi:(2Fe-2S)-binding protein [Brevibacillus sp. 7WMA2]|uniref:2Fe-2S iron-sulfur cluster-binding protein n=1 Tax=Brevibacillus TaxID=55080 RepID=UPI000C7599C8|nr:MULTISPECIES: 2Fe-2S iron-sulfur cluster-binding protein [Brevibacillus]AUM64788.1 ferredoxin [Brevibacillus laterosporus]MBA4534071.1 (2Fe-2S)-binding protein [Brevibacillus halotolerans]MCR8964469.1 (2Fe-2S)-binding protein [Brevibacillus laterosporus]MCR8995288.1 (2Fe-2S)-binding protein [Brevibacillus laterosporus]MCZ0836624.1 2Fe-2S iron-sulfur cluster-binding protein [Brevibacillus halotolerans]
MKELTLVTKLGESHEVIIEKNMTIVKLAKKNKIQWGHACERGICAQCRTKILEGAEFLNEVTKEEKLRLKKAERQDHYRLGCQIQVQEEGPVRLWHVPY